MRSVATPVASAKPWISTARAGNACSGSALSRSVARRSRSEVRSRSPACSTRVTADATLASADARSLSTPSRSASRCSANASALAGMNPASSRSRTVAMIGSSPSSRAAARSRSAGSRLANRPTSTGSSRTPARRGPSQRSMIPAARPCRVRISTPATDRLRRSTRHAARCSLRLRDGTITMTGLARRWRSPGVAARSASRSVRRSSSVARAPCPTTMRGAARSRP